MAAGLAMLQALNANEILPAEKTAYLAAGIDKVLTANGVAFTIRLDL
jgi:glutamate-1-semialdehyde 2,1-aminomutase